MAAEIPLCLASSSLHRSMMDCCVLAVGGCDDRTPVSKCSYVKVPGLDLLQTCLQPSGSSLKATPCCRCLLRRSFPGEEEEEEGAFAVDVVVCGCG
jgi:hypothetical protein